MILNLTIGQQQVTANIVINPSYISNGGGGTWGSITGTLANQTDLNIALNNKVDKVTGKGLSTEDYSTAEKIKLASLSVVPDVTPNPITATVTVDLSKPFQTGEMILTSNVDFVPDTNDAVESFVTRYKIDLATYTPTFSGFTLYDENSAADTASGKINIVVFFNLGGVYFYSWVGSYTGTINDTTPPELSDVSISAITQIQSQLNATSNETATLYWACFANNFSWGAATEAQKRTTIQNGTGAISYGTISLSANISGNDIIDLIAYSTPYDTYYFAKDSSNNYSTVTLIEFSTIARTQLSTPNPSGVQLDSNTARFTWSNISGNAGYSYRSRVNSGAWSGYTSLPTNTTQVDIDGTTGQTIGFELIALGNNTTNIDSASSTEDSVALTANQAPVASNVVILHPDGEGLGDTLTGSYDYSDNESNPESGSTFRWLRDGSPISGATAITRVIALVDQGHELIFEVTPASSAGTSPGAPAQSGALSIPANAAPYFDSISGTAPSGTAQEGQTLTAPSVTYHDADGDAQATTTHKWYTAPTVGGAKTVISGANSATYVPVSGDVGKYIYYGATPNAATGTTPGTEVFSAATAQVTANEIVFEDDFTGTTINTGKWTITGESVNADFYQDEVLYFKTPATTTVASVTVGATSILSIADMESQTEAEFDLNWLIQALGRTFYLGFYKDVNNYFMLLRVGTDPYTSMRIIHRVAGSNVYDFSSSVAVPKAIRLVKNVNAYSVYYESSPGVWTQIGTTSNNAIAGVIKFGILPTWSNSTTTNDNYISIDNLIVRRVIS